jgi:hypothetical protein
VRDFSKKQRSVFYLGQKASHKKTTGLPTFFDNSTSFYCKNLCLGALERLFIKQNSKNRKNQQQQFFSKEFLVSMT